MKERLGNYISEYSVRNKDDQNIPVYSVTNANGFCTEYFGKEVASKDKKTYKLVPRNYFAYNPSRINVGSIDCQTKEDIVIVSPLYVVFSADDRIDNRYLYYYLKSDVANYYIREKATGSVRDNLKFSMLAEFPIKIRPLDEQHNLAKRLDLLKKLIDNYQTEISLLDQLIKSRFVEMFGDPIRNTKSLKTKELKDVMILKAGDFTAASDISAIPSGDNIYPCYGGNGIRGYVAQFNQEGDYSLIGRQGALSGNVQYAKGKFRNTEHALLVTPICEMNSVWLNQLLIILDLKRYQTGAAQPGLSVKNLQEIPIIIVSLDEQEKYASFIERVDKSKAVIQKSLDEAQLLFDSLMQEYFG